MDESNYTNDWVDETNKINDDVLNGAIEDVEEIPADLDVGVKIKPRFAVVDFTKDLIKQRKAEKTTLPVMTRYERTRLIGARATQIAKGARPLVETVGITDPVKKAEKELEERKLPLMVRRYLPDGSYEDWKVTDFEYL